MGSLRFTWVHLDLLGFTWVHLNLLGFTWFHLKTRILGVDSNLNVPGREGIITCLPCLESLSRQIKKYIYRLKNGPILSNSLCFSTIVTIRTHQKIQCLSCSGFIILSS